MNKRYYIAYGSNLNIYQMSPPSKNGHRKATKNGMNRSHSFIFLKTAAFIPRFT